MSKARAHFQGPRPPFLWPQFSLIGTGYKQPKVPKDLPEFFRLHALKLASISVGVIFLELSLAFQLPRFYYLWVAESEKRISARQQENDYSVGAQKNL